MLALAPVICASACVADSSPAPDTANTASSVGSMVGGADSLRPPRYTTYHCDGAGDLTIEDFRTSVHVVDTRGVDVELPAAPPSQTTRYGQPGFALVLEDPKALWMVSGKRPVNCVR